MSFLFRPQVAKQWFVDSDHPGQLQLLFRVISHKWQRHSFSMVVAERPDL